MQTTIRNILFCALLAISTGIPHLQAADVKISAMPAGSALAGTEQIPMVQSAATKKTTPADISTYMLSGSATTEVLANNAGAFDGDSGFTFNATNDTVNLGGATLTADDPVLDLSQTWNNAAVTFTAEKTNVTDTASAAGSLLRDWQVGGVSKVSIGKTGQLNLAYTDLGVSAGQIVFNPNTGTAILLSAASSGSALRVGQANDGATSLVFRPNAVDFGANGRIAFSTTSNNPLTTLDLILVRDTSGALAQRNGTNAQTLRVYDAYTDASNYGRIALNTNLTGDWVQVAAETAGTGGDNYGIALTPTGTGAISAHVPDSTTAGGNARGANAVDWQSATRGAATQVASGANSTVSGGQLNSATGANSVIGGGTTNSATGNTSTVSGGNANTASGFTSAVLGGTSNEASGSYSWVPGGFQASTRGLIGAGAYSSGRRSATGDAQVILQPVRRTTTDATPVSLATDGTPAATTVMVLPSDSTATCRAMVTANSTAAGVVSMAGFDAIAIVKNDSSTITVSGGTCTAIGTADAALTTATCALVANGTLDSIEMQVTGVAATTVYWVAEVKCVQAL